MAVAIRTTDFPEGVGTEMYDGVNAAMDIANNPPDGLIFHWAGEVDGKWTITDVWETREAYDRFRDERLFPAIEKVSGMDPAERSPADDHRVRGPQLRQALTPAGPFRRYEPGELERCSTPASAKAASSGRATITEPRASSIASSTSSESSTPAAWALLCTCSGRDGAGDRRGHLGAPRIHARASWTIVRPA